ncbi:aldo/keto reductase [Acetobacteraceae bacterium ESL0709]|nr:aldo/keto reductase [Acetobacteraceae bacterium ESL0697]MDF7678999.1 aldo/keto reductase [Acetobacteraceae bacterium ESL0709]
MTTALPVLEFRNGLTVPRLGMGTWAIGDAPDKRQNEIEALRYGLDAGLRVIDTAEMYGNGRSEMLVGEAISDRRKDVFLTSKLLPSHASYDKAFEACERSLRHLKTDYLDLYLLHWRGSVPLKETVRAFDALKQQGMIKAWGVSNFDCDDMEELEVISPDCQTNQVLYNLEHRGIEFDLLPYDTDRKVITTAYSPLGQGKTLLQHPALRVIAARHTTALGPATPAQIALAWTLQKNTILVIPKASTPEHQKNNIAALEITLTDSDLAELNRAFPPPSSKLPLAML